MESRSSTPVSFSPSPCNFYEIMNFGVQKDDKMDCVVETENVECSNCNKKKELLAKREELIWQREDMVHTREKELRELELIIEKRKQKLLEKERQLKCKEDVHSSGENSRKSSVCNDDIKNENNSVKNEFLLEKEKLLLERERVISEKIEHIELREQNILSKEKLFEDEKTLITRERELIAEKEHELDSREQIIKKNEESKLTTLYKDIKAADDRIELLNEKENALSVAAEIMQTKEKSLNERENMVIEKEKSVINLINELNKKHIFNEQPNRENEILEKFDEIFNIKMKVILQRENTIRTNELLLEEKWKKYNEAKELLKLEEKNLLAMRNTFEKEKVIFRGWDNYLEKQEVDVTGKNEIREVVEEKELSLLSCVLEKEKNVEGNCVIRDENISRQNKISDLECKEISGNELFQFYEKERERLQNSLLNEIIVMSGKELGNSNTQNHKLNENAQSFFPKVITPGRTNDTKHAPEVSGGYSQSLETVSITKETEKNIISEISTSNSVVGSNKERNIDLCGQEAQITTETVEAESVGKIYVNDIDVNKGNNKSEPQHDSGTSQKCIDVLVLHKNENEGNFQNSNGCPSEENELKEEDNASSSFINNIHPDISNKTSRSSSVSSAKSPTFFIGDEASSRPAKRQRKPARDALLQAISKRDFLETVQLLDMPCISLKGRNGEGRTAFLLAVESGNVELVGRLISMGADIRASDYRGSSALHIAVTNNDEEMVRFLLKSGLNPGVTDTNGNNVLQLASKLNNTTVVTIINNYKTLTSS